MAGLSVYRGKVPLLVGSTLSEWNDMVDLIGAELVADVARTHVPLEDALTSSLFGSAADRDPLLACRRGPCLRLAVGAVGLG